MNKFEIGDTVQQIKAGYQTSPDDNYRVAVVIDTTNSEKKYKEYSGSCASAIKIDDSNFRLTQPGWRGDEAFKLIKRVSNQQTQTKGESTMNKTIAKLFEKTADAILVEKYLGSFIQPDPVDYIALNGKQEELLKEAKQLEKEAKEKK